MASISKIKNVQPLKAISKVVTQPWLIQEVGEPFLAKSGQAVQHWLRWVRTPIWHQTQSLSAAAGGTIH